jgi:hypothetical protein
MSESSNGAAAMAAAARAAQTARETAKLEQK